MPAPPPESNETPSGALLASERGAAPVVEGDLLAVAAIEAGVGPHKRKLGMGAWFAIGWMAFILGIAIIAPLLPIDDPNVRVKLEQPCPTSPGLGGVPRENCYISGRGPFADDGAAPGYLFGGDGNSRSMLSRLVYGARTSLAIATGAVALGFLIGGGLGMIAGYFGGKIDTVLTSVFNVLLSIPAIILALSLVAFLAPQSDQESGGGGSGLPTEVILIIAIGVVAIPLLGRITRASALIWSQREFVLAARAQGAKNMRIMIREVLPNVLPAMFSIALLGIAVAIVAEGALSILGVGVRPPTASWGNMIAAGAGDFQTAPHIVFEPALLVFFTVFALNFLGDVVRARFDVREAGI